MTRLELLQAELTHEARITRRHLERLPTEHFGWRPHARSFTAGQLASHLVDCMRWVAPTFNANELEMDPRSYTPTHAQSAEELLTLFDREIATASHAMGMSADHSCDQLWQLRMHGTVHFEKPREAVFRDMTMNHLIHHRGQLTVYLRLLDIPLVSTYGPTADDGR